MRHCQASSISDLPSQPPCYRLDYLPSLPPHSRNGCLDTATAVKLSDIIPITETNTFFSALINLKACPFSQFQALQFSSLKTAKCVSALVAPQLGDLGVRQLITQDLAVHTRVDYVHGYFYLIRLMF